MPLKKTLTPLVVAVLFLLAGLLTTWYQWNKQKQSELQNALSSLVFDIESVFNNARTLATMASLHTGGVCTHDDIRNLSRLAASVNSVRSVNIIEKGEWHCSSLEGRQSPGIHSPGTTTDAVLIERVHRQENDMYMAYFPFKGQVVAVAVYEAAIDNLLLHFAQAEQKDVVFALTSYPAGDDMGAVSLEYPFSVTVKGQSGLNEYFADNTYTVLLFALLSLLLFVHLRYVLRHSPVRTLAQAIRNDEFIPFYQPVVELASGKVTGAEALVRWQHPGQGIIPPNEFIHAAEQNGLINQMTAGMMDRIVSDLRCLDHRADKPFHLGINLPPSSFSDDGFVRKLLSFILQVKRFHVTVMIEITERQQNLVDSDILMKIKKAGAELALDDFGTGYSNFEALQRIEPTFLKIDRMFIDSLGKSGVNETIVTNIVHLSAVAKIPLVAEGIETEQQRDALRALGVESGQGYYYSRPLPFHDFIRFCREHISH